MDIGCGKGAVLRTAASYPFDRIGGIEYVDYIADICRKNMKILGLSDRVECFCQDATKFERYGEYDTFYMFNPFEEEILSKVFDRIMEQKPSDKVITVIYLQPWFLDTLKKKGKCTIRAVLNDKLRGSDTVILDMK